MTPTDPPSPIRDRPHGADRKPPGKAELMALRAIPGVGPSLAHDLWRLGARHPDDLRGADPQALYERLMELEGHHVDRCVLYVFRCAVHWAEGPDPDPEMAKWWNWSDENLARRGLG